ncbi:hypothetical protein [Pseudalkalibacillus decolorationis]|uniref:hypothetical protein n=1 Tax=Pseudalkalibacillus decolorationis TaxID=163879 RepID=UPI0021480DBC|nr:hypothetical protein [Pseudalkalibacillus decolorationis]
MKRYFKQQKFGVSTTREFISSMEKSTNRDLLPFFEDHRVFLSDQELLKKSTKKKAVS